MMLPKTECERFGNTVPPVGESEIVIVDRRALWRHALTAALAAIWSDVTFRTVNTHIVATSVEPGDAAAAVLLGGLGLAQNAELRDDVSRVASALPTTPILLITDRIDAADVASAIRAGAKGYLTSDASLPILIQSLRLMMVGGSVFPDIEPTSGPIDSASGLGVQHATTRRREGATSLVGLFTPKEREVLSCLGEGKSNKIIAYELDICETTVKVHMGHIMRKLGATNRTQAALLAREMLTPIG